MRALAILIAVTLPMAVRAGEEETKRLAASADTLKEVMAGDQSIPADLFKKSKCAVVIPGMKKGGFVFTGKFGRGYASCRKAGGGWSAPAGMRIEGGGFGLQAGASETDVIMLVMSEKGMKGILKSDFTLGGEVSAAAGPVGRDVTAQTDATMKADILSWSRSSGLFGGLSLQGGTLREDEEGNKGLYGGNNPGNANILAGKVPPPKEAVMLESQLVQHGGKTAAH